MASKKKQSRKKQEQRYGLKAQIEDAQKMLKSWPKWMKELARFEGVDKLP